ncbi:hypothetical protein HMPREF0880_01708 [Yokenella regensburgei ATCC 43003]|jgi:hypothetical protein|nr:hypothetical protein HMPREF0880_01708 [Yokenella regensburgei ATCC 43003]
MEGSYMKYRIVIALVFASLSSAVYAASPCKDKAQDIQREISYAEKHHNQHRVDGLKKALSEVNAHCSDSQVLADHQKKIDKQKADVAERKDDLREAQQKGDPDKIKKRERKLEEAQDELKALESRDY